jgi:hypothetical protein
MNSLCRVVVYSVILAAVVGCSTMPAGSGAHPNVSVGDDAIVVTFPGGRKAVATLALRDGLVTGLSSVSVGKEKVLAPLPEGARPPIAKVIVGGAIAPVTDLAAYLEERAEIGDQHTFPKRGELELSEMPIAGPLLGWHLEDKAVVIEIGLTRGRAEWVLTPASAKPHGGEYSGVSWQLRLHGVGRVYEVFVQEPAAFGEGDWRLQQRGNQSNSRAEEVFQLSHAKDAEPHTISKRNYNARQQPFFFIAGNRGATLSYFDRLSRSDVGEVQEGDRIVLQSAIPVRADDDGVIATPVKSWLFRPANLTSKWDAINAWTWAWDFVLGYLQAQMGILPVEPRPTLFHQQFDTPGIEYGMTAEKRKAMDPPALEDSWLYQFANDMVPKAAEWGMGVIELRAVLDTDIDHSGAEFPNGSFAGGSVCSPWGLAISPKLGGSGGMAYLVDKAHKHGIKVIIWSAPAHQSVCAPVVRLHPEWLMLNDEGRVNNRGYVTLVGMDLAAGYGEYMADAYRRLREEAGLDGVWADSYCAFGSDRDMSDPWPYPQLDEAVKLQRAMQDMGYTVLLKEGCGPFGLSTRSGGLHDILGHEYMRYFFLYNHSDSTRRYDPDSYFRSLASKGVMEIRVPQDFEAQPEEARDRIIRANRAYNEVLPLMKRRFVIGDGEKWFGVIWADASGRKRVLYSFERFQWLAPKNAKGRELITGESIVVSERLLDAEPWRVYVLD